MVIHKVRDTGLPGSELAVEDAGSHILPGIHDG
jgi:hypothetical protein